MERPEPAGPGGSSGTTTVTTTTTTTTTAEPRLILRLRAPPRSVAWDASVVDNEHMNKRKSKKCCIFHKQRPFDESDSEREDDDGDEGGWELGPDGKPVWVVPGERRCSCGGGAHDHSHDGDGGGSGGRGAGAGAVPRA